MDHERFKFIADALPMLIAYVDTEERYCFNNAAYERWFNCRRQDIAGRTVREVLGDTAYATVSESIRSALAGNSVSVEGQMAYKLGEARYVRATCQPDFGPDGAVRGFAVLVEDISARHRAEEELRRTNARLAASNEELSQFTYVAAHDLKEPLRTMKLYLQLIESRLQGKLDPECREFMGFVRGGATRLHKLITDLLAYASVGKYDDSEEPVDLTAVLEDTRRNLASLLRDHEAELSIGELPVVCGNRAQLGQLFQNLVGNAVKFRGPQAPRVKVEAERRDDGWVVTVADNGIGIATQFQERIFALFQRLHSPDLYAGTGIGLAVCKKVAERHGGRIWVESSPGEGSRFRVSLPASRYSNSAATSA